MTYKVLKRTQEDAFSLFMRGLEPKTWEQVGFHIEGDLGQAMAMVRRWMCGEKNQKRTKMDKTHKNLEGIGRGSRDHKLQIKQKAREGEAGFWACNRRKRDYKKYRRAHFWFCCCGYYRDMGASGDAARGVLM